MTILIMATCLNHTAALFNYNLGIKPIICHVISGGWFGRVAFSLALMFTH